MINLLSFACQVVEGVPGCSALYLASSDLLFPNKRWEATFGNMFRLHDLEGLGLSVTDIRDEIVKLMQTEHGQFVHPMDEESVRTLVVSAIPKLPQMYFIFINDETEAHRLAKMRKDFIANVSHELRTPLTIIRGYVETLMTESFRTPEYLNEFLPILQDNVEQMNRLVLDLLDLSRIESAGAIRLVTRSLKPEIDEAVETSRPLAAKKKIKIIHTKIDSVPVKIDIDTFQRALINLIENAIKYSPDEETIKIYTEVDSTNQIVTVHIVDNGVGIPEDEQERIFERFYRVRSTGGEVKGSGLGLAIVKHALQTMGAEIKLQSVLNEGSDFYFTLQIYKPE